MMRSPFSWRLAVADDIVTRLRERQREVEEWWPDPDDVPLTLAGEAADEIERLRAQVDALHVVQHKAIWDDTLIPIANAFGVGLEDEHGVPRRHFQMLEAIIKAARRG
jgi:hypothetical protein